VMRQGGVKLVEVGTTNRTYLADYEDAVTERTAALMRVHSSNFRLVGFVHETSLEDLVDAGRRHDIPVLDDLGSGCFLDTAAFGLDPEPTVQQSVAAGAGLVFFSGDKLVGGPQAGIIVGHRHLVDRLKKHPLARALRIDKTRLAALSATLVHYLRGEATGKIPVWRMIAAPRDDIDRRAREWAAVLGEAASIIDGESMVGGGSLPGGTLPTRLVSLASVKGKRGGVQALAAALRRQSPPVIGRIDNDALLLDPRSVLPEEDPVVIRALRNLTV
ncbi:MAG: L-seryl-tRNA(Sec) selenium transferase, partial [Dehalococcoidales bacterium]